MKYLCNDIFMVRAPSLPLKTFFEFNDSKDSILEYVSKDTNINDFIKEGLLISSKSLYQSFISPSINEKKIRDLNSGISKYMTRASTRPTPFGLLAGVGLGEFSNETEIIIDQNNYKKDAKVDTQWIYHVIHEFQKDINVVSQLKLKFNPICYLKGNRLKNPYYSNHGDIDKYKEHIEENDIKYTDLIKLIREKTQRFIHFSEIKRYIKEVYKGVPDSLIDNTMLMLIENEYLITELRIPSFCNDTLGHVIKTLQYNEYTSKQVESLKEIRVLLRTYKEAGTNPSMLKMIHDKMKAIYETKNYLQVNKGIILNKNFLKYEIKDEIEHFANSLNSISEDASEYSKLNKFKEAFSERFGLNVEVPLIDIIDRNGFNGLSLIMSSNGKISEREMEIKRIIDNKIMEALMNGNEEVNLYNEDFSKILGVGKKENPTKSFDMNFYIVKNEIEKNHNIIVGSNIGSHKAGKMFQRFYDCLDIRLMEEYNKIYAKEIEIAKDEYLIVEVRETPVAGRVKNITNNYKNHEYYLAISNTDENVSGEIFIDDLCIGLSQERKLYIKSMSKNKKCKVIVDNMLVSHFHSKMISLLLAISDEYEDKITDRILTLYKNQYIYTPRIKFKNIIVQPRSWRLNIRDFEIENLEAFKNSFNNTSSKYKIDEYVYLCESDNRLLLDLKREEALKIIYSSLKKNKEIILCEAGIFWDTIVKDSGGNQYIAEFVFSFIQDGTNRRLELLSEKDNFIQDNRIFQSENNEFPLGTDGWIYMKLYGVEGRENELLTKEIPWLLYKLDVQKFFFIRYFDGEKHMRLRFKLEDENGAIDKLHIINSWNSELKKKGLIDKPVFDMYKRESNRYGGIKLIEYAEQFFYIDSLFVIEMLSLFDLDNENDRKLVYLVGMISVLKELTHDENEMFKVLDEKNLRNQYRDEFRKERLNYIKITEYVLKGELEKVDDRLSQIINIYKRRQESLSDFRIQLENQIKDRDITNSKDFDLDLKQIKTNNEVGPQAYTEDFWNCTKEIISVLSDAACGLPSTEGCSLSDMQDCGNVAAGIGINC